MSTINQLLESANPWQSLQNDAARLAGKWAKSGLLEGLSGYDKTNMSMLLENQAKQLIVETNTSGPQSSPAAGWTNGNGYQWAGVALPMIRKIFGQVVAKEFVSVQPMSMPSGLIFYLDFQYGTDKAPFSAGDSLYGTPAPGFGNSNFSNLAEGGYYGQGRYGYTRNEFSSSVAVGGRALALSTVGDFAKLNFDSRYSGSLAGSTGFGSIYEFTCSLSAVSGSTVPDLAAISAWYLKSGSSILPTQVLAELTYADTTANKLYFYITGSTSSNAVNPVTATTASSTVFFFKNTTMNPFNAGDFEDGNSLSTPNAQSNSTIVFPEINIKLRSDSITAETRKMKAQWTPEFAQDLNAYQNLDAEAELTSLLSEQISMEIDLEILGMLLQGAATTEYWSAKVGNQINSTQTAFVSNTAGVYYNQMSWFQTLGIKLQKISNIIHQRTLRGGANFMIISPAVATILESIPGFAADNTDAETMKYAFGVQKIGAINGRYKVYKNPYFKDNTILLGYKGGQFLETGAVYAPYVPLIMTPLIYDPETFTPRKGIMTRYAKKMIRPDYYGKILVADLDVV
jgi:hypothetical protein